jgi:choline dehydrogenase-like flavoprotein
MSNRVSDRPAFGEATRRIVEAIGRVCIPVTPKLSIEVEPIVGVEMDRFLRALPPTIRRFYIVMIWLIELGSILRYGRRFTHLDRAQQAAYLGFWHQRFLVLRLALRAVLTPVKLAYFANPEVGRRIGYLAPTTRPQRPDLKALPGVVIPGEEATTDLAIHCEVVVIGTGAGGAAVAKELAELGRDVVLLEEGVWHSTESFSRRAYDMSVRMYRDLGLTIAFGRPGIPIPLGRTVGGTTTINSGTCFRVPEKVIDKWQSKFQLPITVEELAPLYDRVEKIIEVQPVPDRVLGRNAELVMLGAERIGLKGKPLNRNAANCQGSGLCCFGCPTEAKKSTNVTYVPMALKAGARLITGVKAERVVVEGGRASGVIGRFENGNTLWVRADSVVVACGTIYTPLLLQRSGLAGKSRQLGRNLSIHPATKVMAMFDEEVKGWTGVPQGLGIEDLAEEGIVFEGAFTPPEYGAVGLPFFGPRFVDVMERYSKIGCFGFLVEDQSQGRVFPGLDGRPTILYNVSEQELTRIRRGTEVLCRIFLAAGAKVVYSPLSSVEEIRSEAELAKLPERFPADELELTAFHPLGTCRMGVDPRTSVIDPWLEHHQVDGLHVADGSIFPSSLGRNPQLTIMAFATREASIIDERLAGTPRYRIGN